MFDEPSHQPRRVICEVIELDRGGLGWVVFGTHVVAGAALQRMRWLCGFSTRFDKECTGYRVTLSNERPRFKGHEFTYLQQYSHRRDGTSVASHEIKVHMPLV